MNHEAASAKLLDLAYGELPPREAQAVEAHVTACEECRAELTRIRDTRALMALLPAEPPPERGEAVVMAAARAAAEARKPKPLLPAWLWAGTAAAMGAVLVAVVSWRLAGTSPASRERESDLLGRGPSIGIAPSPPPGERVGVRGPAAPAEAPPKPTVAKRDGWIALGEETKKKEAPSSPAPRAEAAPAAKPSGSWKAAPPEAEAAADAFGNAPPASMATPSPAPPPAAAPEPAASRAFAEAPGGGASSGGASARFERKAAAPMAQREKAEPLGAVGAGRTETREFPGCAGELRRIVERDADGRVVRYVRIGARRELDQRYGPDGRLVAAWETVAKTARALPLGEPGLVRLARDAGIDAAPRCTWP